MKLEIYNEKEEVTVYLKLKQLRGDIDAVTLCAVDSTGKTLLNGQLLTLHKEGVMLHSNIGEFGIEREPNTHELVTLGVDL